MKLKPCPHCGKPPEVDVTYTPSSDGDDWRNTDIYCFQHNFIHDAETWNTRPIEDELIAVIKALVACIDPNEGISSQEIAALDLAEAAIIKAEGEK